LLRRARPRVAERAGRAVAVDDAARIARAVVAKAGIAERRARGQAAPGAVAEIGVVDEVALAEGRVAGDPRRVERARAEPVADAGPAARAHPVVGAAVVG